MREDTRQRATEFIKELYAAGAIDADRLDSSVDEVLAESTRGWTRRYPGYRWSGST